MMGQGGRLVQLVVCGLWLVTCQAQQKCPAQEGTKLTLECSGNMGNMYNRRFDIWWTATMFGPAPQVVSTCYLGSRCTNHRSLNFTATRTDDGMKYKSQLTIHQVTILQDQQLFRCIDQNNVHKSTCLLSVYYEPENAKCAAESLDDGRVHVICQTSKVFPDLSCQMSLVLYDDNSSVESQPKSILDNSVTRTDISYKKEEQLEGEAVYYSVTCSAYFAPQVPGTYVSQVKMYPKRPGVRAQVPHRELFTDTVTVKTPYRGKLKSVAAPTEGIITSDTLELDLDTANRATNKDETPVPRKELIHDSGKPKFAEARMESVMSNDKLGMDTENGPVVAKHSQQLGHESQQRETSKNINANQIVLNYIFMAFIIGFLVLILLVKVKKSKCVHRMKTSRRGSSFSEDDHTYVQIFTQKSSNSLENFPHHQQNVNWPERNLTQDLTLPNTYLDVTDSHSFCSHNKELADGNDRVEKPEPVVDSILESLTTTSNMSMLDEWKNGQLGLWRMDQDLESEKPGRASVSSITESDDESDISSTWSPTDDNDSTSYEKADSSSQTSIDEVHVRSKEAQNSDHAGPLPVVDRTTYIVHK